MFVVVLKNVLWLQVYGLSHKAYLVLAYVIWMLENQLCEYILDLLNWMDHKLYLVGRNLTVI